MSIRIKELMETLTQANEAQEAVPAMKAELARLQRALDASQKEAERYKQASEDIGVDLHDAEALVSKLGDERDEAMFHALELEEKLGSITKVMGSALGLVAPPAVSSVKAEEPKEEPIAQAQAQPTESTSWRQEEYGRHDEEHRHWNDPYPTPSAPEVAPSSPIPPQGEAGASVPSEELSSSYSNSQSDTSGPVSASTEPMPEPRPAYLGVRWQDKPGHLSWSNFIDQGGEKPYWM